MRNHILHHILLPFHFLLRAEGLTCYNRALTSGHPMQRVFPQVEPDSPPPPSAQQGRRQDQELRGRLGGRNYGDGAVCTAPLQGPAAEDALTSPENGAAAASDSSLHSRDVMMANTVSRDVSGDAASPRHYSFLTEGHNCGPPGYEREDSSLSTSRGRKVESSWGCQHTLLLHGSHAAAPRLLLNDG